MRTCRGPARRGVLLLIILALLAMFGLVAVAFIVITGHSMRSAQAIQRIGQSAARPEEELHQAFLQVVRGPTNPGSVLGPHALLEDIYGGATYVGAINSVNPGLCGGQLIEFSTGDAANDLRRGGCVVTMLSGTAAGQSTHIVGISPTGLCQALAFQIGTPQNSDQCLINGAPYSGTGFGYNTNTGKLDLGFDSTTQTDVTIPDPNPTPSTLWPVALLPNYATNRNPAGGANEDYDAVEFQNMLLAAQIVDPTTLNVTTIPSLHRPELVNYWRNRAAPTWDDPNWNVSGPLQRRVILRPLPQDHYIDLNNNKKWDPEEPDFTGKVLGQNFNLVDGPWDVDNDGDGLPDGIWVDLGMPVRAAPDGRLYKPLFSILCLDLDGRLNLNAHGNWDQTRPPYYYDQGAGTGVSTGEFPPEVLALGTPRFAGGGTGPVGLPRGQGYGPAEINLRPLLLDPANLLSQWDVVYRQLLGGIAALGVDGRYGEAPGGAPREGLSNMDDWLSRNKDFEYWGNYWGFLGAGSYLLDAYGSPPNVYGMGAVGLDMAGRPLYLSMGQQNGQNTDDPYELDLSPNRGHGLSSPAPIDNPFSVGELERLLRPFDRDAGRLPSRLWTLTYDNNVGRSVLHDRRHAITTEGWDLPCPSVALPKALRDALSGKRAGQVSDLLRAMLVKRGVPDASIPGIMGQLLPPEMLAGLKMDLNRPLGNGRDDNGNGVVDEPGEVVPPGSPEQLTLYTRPGNLVTVNFSYGADGSLADSLAARQLHARHLYVLLLLLADTEYLNNSLGGPEATAQFLAQWAVNVVDFYDRDSIMTPFPYDPNPFDGWNESPQYVVWGCERPELLISETLAFHDRRTEDLEDPNKRTDDKEKPDDDFDQKKRPQGSLFVEIFNPWTALEPPPGEFCYDRTSGTWAGGVRLNQTTPNGGHPVWRLIIVEPEEDSRNPGEHADPDDPQTANRPDIERSVYFVNPSAVDPKVAQDGARYYPSMPPASVAPVMPGRYAVVGPGEENPQSPSHTKTYIGLRSGQQSGDGTTRQIDLTGPTPPQPNVVKNNSDAQPGANNIYPPAVIVIDSPHRLSVSEPTGGYSLPEGATKYDPISEEYDVAGDQPLDKTDNAALWDILKVNQTNPKFRIVHLQRLANPLLPWNPVINPNPKLLVNPYLTIDSMPIDLTAFNGVTSETNQNQNPDGDTDGSTLKFVSRERGRKEGDINNLWKQENGADPLPAAANPPVQNHYFNKALQHSLGYLNECFYLNSPTNFPLDSSTGYKGDPPRPFPWLTWNNRPFVSQLELLLVPALRSSKLLVCNATDEHKYFRFVKGGVTPYDPPATPAINVPYPHLLNFFQSAKSDPAGSSPQLHRLLEYVGVPSRFVGAQLQGNPTVFAAAVGHSFHPPFNLISRYREPGRINLNTIFDKAVFDGLINNFPGMNTPDFWGKFVASRRGYGAGADVLARDNAFPTYFARPFRSFAGGEMVPLASMEPVHEVDATLLRSDGGTPPQPLFEYNPATQQPYNDTNRNPYFRYQGLQRLGNLVTTRSNVYAIWITVGYFEVEPNANGIDDGHPDGYRLVQELGIDSGEVQRHRAFYIFDRSIPVGFRRGQDLNVESAVLVERFIE